MLFYSNKSFIGNRKLESGLLPKKRVKHIKKKDVNMTEENRAIPFQIKLADVNVRIEPMFDYIREYCKDYITEEGAEFLVRTEAADLLFERERSRKEAQLEGREDINYTDAYLETLAVYRRIAEHFPHLGILLFHGSVIAVDGVGYLFTAKSGTGKSTHTRLWRQQFGERAVMVNDDKPLLRITENGVFAYGTPWDGKHRLSCNISVPLKAICVLTRDEKNHIEEIEPREVYQMLLQQAYRPTNQVSMIQTLQNIDLLMKKTKFYRLGCNRNPEAAIVAFQGMNKENEENLV